MAGCNFSYSGHTGVINASASVYELSTSGTTRQVRLVVQVYAIDYSGARDGGYSVSCSQSGTYVEVPTYNGFAISGSAQTIFDEVFSVSIARGASTAAVDFSFSAWLISPSSGQRTISGSITQLSLTKESAASPSAISLNVSSVQMGKKLLIALDADNGGCTHTLRYAFGGASGEIGSGIKGSKEWTVPDLADKCPDALSGICTIRCTTYLDGTSLGETEAEVTLTVPDPTVPSLSGGEATLGMQSSISCKRNSPHFTLGLELEFKGETYSIVEGKLDSCSWTPDYDLAKKIPSLVSGTGTLRCITRNGTAVVGTGTATIRLTVPENDITRPKLDALTLSPVGSLPEAFAGLYLRGMTGLQAVFTASSPYSTVTDYSLTAVSQTASGNPAVIDLLVTEGEVKVTGKVTDARGFSSSLSLTVPVIPYRSPRITPGSGYDEVICQRATASGELSPQGTFLAIRAGRSYSSVVLNGREQNRCTLRCRWKPNGGSFGSWETLLPEDSTDTEVRLLMGNAVSSLQKSYLVELEALDTLGGRHSLTFQIMTEEVSFVLYDGPDGAGFGKYPEQPHVVDIASHMTLLVRGNLQVLGENWVSLGLAAGISESAYSHGRKESGCHYLLTEGRQVHLACNAAFPYRGLSLVLNEAPIPAEHRPRATVMALCPCNDRCLACISVDTDGYVRAEWVQKITDTAMTGSADVTWIDGYLSYWI